VHCTSNRQVSEVWFYRHFLFASLVMVSKRWAVSAVIEQSRAGQVGSKEGYLFNYFTSLPAELSAALLYVKVGSTDRLRSVPGRDAG
jgi:hypothetical protein